MYCINFQFPGMLCNYQYCFNSICCNEPRNKKKIPYASDVDSDRFAYAPFPIIDNVKCCIQILEGLNIVCERSMLFPTEKMPAFIEGLEFLLFIRYGIFVVFRIQIYNILCRLCT